LEPLPQRELFGLFKRSHPAVQSFTEGWLKAEPENPYALTAAGWQEYSLGAILRGHRDNLHTSIEALQRFRSLNRRAVERFQAAVAAAPDLLSASDGVLDASGKLGRIENIPVEIERVMALHPNRGSLMRAMLAPQWGGGIDKIGLLCNRYAAMITSVPGYDTAICYVDGVYFSDFPAGQVRDVAREALMEMPKPILDPARRADAIAQLGPAEWRLSVLEGIQAKAPLYADEAQAYDYALAETIEQIHVEFPQLRAALPAAITDAEKLADLDPLNSDTVVEYFHLLMLNWEVNETAFDKAGFAPRLTALLRENPYSANARMHLGEIELGTGSLAELKAAQPYFDNALYYSGHDLDMLQGVIDARIWRVLDPKPMTPEMQAEYDLFAYCPLARDLLASRMLCGQAKIYGKCLSGFSENERIMHQLMDAHKRHECTALKKGLDLDTLMVKTPVAVDLSMPEGSTANQPSAP
jgi:hypothetical protein